jgi:mRNA interferase HigB
MRVVGKEKIEIFYKNHAQAKGPLLAWRDEVENAVWKTPQEIKQRFAHASFLPNNVVIFNIGGNKFRLTVTVRYQAGIALVMDVSTHADYDKKNKKTKRKKA